MNDKINDKIAKAIQIKKAIKDLGIIENSEIYPELDKFSKILNNWVFNDEWNRGQIKILNLKKKLIYDLRDPEKTTIILREV